MSLKMEFVRRATASNANVSALCREFNIARETGHKWIKRFKEDGYDGLEERSRRPRSTPLAAGEDLVVAIVEAREAHPTWGPHKLHVLLRRRFGAQTPTERTVARVLVRFDKVRQRKRRPPVSVVTQAPSVVASAPNDLWTVDFKGWWRAQNGDRCEPLTVRDACSRFVLATRVLTGTNALAVRAVFERLFKRNGLPKMIQCDNGTPFVSVRARAGLSALSAWWVSLGIKIVRSRPGCPQDNGGHERMHSDIAKEIQVIPCDTRDSQQRACDKWRHEFNHIRPHAALKDKTPAEVYKISERRMRARIAVYPSAWVVRKVNTNGHVRIAAEFCFISAALRGYHVGLQPVDALHWRAWFYDVDLGLVEVAPSELPEALALRAMKLKNASTASVATSSTPSAHSRSKRSPAHPRASHASQSQMSKARSPKGAHSKARSRRS